MTPNEKAKELVDKFWDATPEQTSFDPVNHAKQCALIAVDEIMRLHHYLPRQEITGSTALYSTDYWKQVKQEIEKL